MSDITDEDSNMGAPKKLDAAFETADGAQASSMAPPAPRVPKKVRAGTHSARRPTSSRASSPGIACAVQVTEAPAPTNHGDGLSVFLRIRPLGTTETRGNIEVRLAASLARALLSLGLG